MLQRRRAALWKFDRRYSAGSKEHLSTSFFSITRNSIMWEPLRNTSFISLKIEISGLNLV
uniref:Uncharacterized protein n=1 Tax=Anguilla anguilla TaxID=7936 RepID=A0A0E9R051_ANGAN